MHYHVIASITVSRQIMHYNVRCRQFKLQVKLFFAFFSHRSVECERLIAKNWFLASANAFFRSKNGKNLKGLVFFKKHNFFKMCKIFHFFLLTSFWKYFFQIQYQKLSIDKLLNRLQPQNSISDGASNRVECTTYRSIL